MSYIEPTNTISVPTARERLNGTIKALSNNFSGTSTPSVFTVDNENIGPQRGMFYHNETIGAFTVFDTTNSKAYQSNWTRQPFFRNEESLTALRANVAKYEIGEVVSTCSDGATNPTLYLIKDNAAINSSIVLAAETQINDRSLTEAFFADDAVITRTITAGSVTTDKFADDAVNSAKLGELGTTAFKNSGVENVDFSSNISGAKIIGSVTGSTTLEANALSSPSFSISGTDTNNSYYTSDGQGGAKFVEKNPEGTFSSISRDVNKQSTIIFDTTLPKNRFNILFYDLSLVTPSNDGRTDISFITTNNGVKSIIPGTFFSIHTERLNLFSYKWEFNNLGNWIRIRTEDQKSTGELSFYKLANGIWIVEGKWFNTQFDAGVAQIGVASFTSPNTEITGISISPSYTRYDQETDSWIRNSLSSYNSGKITLLH